MKNLLLSLILFSSLSFAGWLGQNDYTFPVAISFSSASISSVWANVGDPIKAVGYKRIVYPVTFAINSGSNVRFRVMWQETSGGTNTDYNINTVSASDYKLEPRYYEFNVDANATSLLDFSILPVGYVQLQTKCGSEPVNKTLDATLTSVKYILLGE
jgi:hypothetical protein